MLRINPEILFTLVAGITVFIGLGTFIIIILLQQQKRKFSHHQQMVELKRSAEQTLLQSQLEIKEQTLANIGRELHDNFAQIASLIKINLLTIPRNDAQKASEKIEHTIELTRELIADLKSLSVSLNGDKILMLGLSKALKLEIDNLNKVEILDATFSCDEDFPNLESSRTIILYRISQEIINNAIKHSKATKFDISLRHTQNSFTLAFIDNGIGFSPNQIVNENSGSGLHNLIQRSRLIGAEILIDSTPTNGCCITIQSPINNVTQNQN